ncbi:acetyl-CoA synthetase [Actinomadura sp. NBRC 104412]|uniref:acetate--CoA ligase family protein n=1 Tax=Actinomadura sp. NBRC 104412 TaxID=3032203 RepID=UPI0024A42A83|nr:acetate--CoA ligase [Actinomadura sp. NBRC 104412]GLZ08285.1 acetyl-CoA synthetase [Actinomadura sp. NBRC 104412]
MTGRDANMRLLLRPSSVAIVGCSPVASGKLSSWPLRGLLRHRSPVDIYPVNPRYEEIDGLRAYPSLRELPVTPDLALVVVPAGAVMDVLEAAEERGVPAAVVYGAGPAGEPPPTLDDRVRAFAARSSMAVCGPNTNGIVNVTDGIVCGLAPYAQLGDRLPAGDIALVSQSGALISSLVLRLTAAGLGLTCSIAVGNAVVLGVGDYLRLLAADERTKVIVVYAEGVADRAGFLAGADAAIAAGKPVIVFKAGRSAEGGAAAAGHTGVLAGPYDAFAAVCERHGIVLADSVEEIAALAALLRQRSRRGGGRVGIVSGSGGVGVILADEARRAGVEVPPLAGATAGRLSGLLARSTPRNPLDLTDQVVGDVELTRRVLAAVADDPGVDHLVFGVLHGPQAIQDRMKRDLEAVAASGADVIAYTATGTTADREPILAGAGIPVIDNAPALFSALAKVTAPEPRPARPVPHDPAAAEEARALWSAVPPGGRMPGDAAWRLLELYGIPAAREHPVTDAAHAREVAGRLGYPVALKAGEVAHRTDEGLVRLGLDGPEAVERAHDELAPAGTVVVQKMTAAGHELIAAVRHEPESGPYVLVGTGGIYTEVLRDTVLIAPPFDRDHALEAIGRMRGAALLNGVRNTGKADVGAVADVLVSLAGLGAAMTGARASLELNPLIVGGRGAIAVDVLATKGR